MGKGIVCELNIHDCVGDLIRVQRAAYQREAELIGFPDLPPLKETAEDLLISGETFLGWLDQGEICGVISFKIDQNHLDIHRLVVSPDHFRRGIATHLLREIECKYKDHDLSVSTAENNVPAVRFYKANGFDIVDNTVIDERLTLTHFMKKRETEDIR